ncbi:hypothetical protein PG991_016100 [Apiospora marii]|uniref:WW domain-containing protein n=1 Tax=Apiospora marii TaxID=335849 RepID=A0ABR1R2D5_9PEZI
MPKDVATHWSCERNEISRAFAERMLGHKIGHGPSGVDTVRIIFKIAGQKQRFDTSHNVIDEPSFENILFSCCRRPIDASEPSPLELHILNRESLSDGCTCCNGNVCRIADLNCDGRYSWYNATPKDLYPGLSTVEIARDAEPAPVVGLLPTFEKIQIQGKTKSEDIPISSQLQASVTSLALPRDCEPDPSGDGMQRIVIPRSAPKSEPSTIHQLSKDTARMHASSLEGQRGLQNNDCRGKEVADGTERRIQLEAAFERETCSSPVSLMLLKQNAYETSSNVFPNPSHESISDMVEARSTTSGPQPNTNSTPVDLNEGPSKAEKQVARLELGSETTECHEWLMVQEYCPERNEYPQEQHSQHPDSALLPERSSITAEGNNNPVYPRAVPRDDTACGNSPRVDGNADTDFADKEEFPLLPFPDDYWTYDKEADNYYHIGHENNGQQTKVWYPREFLEAHRNDEM